MMSFGLSSGMTPFAALPVGEFIPLRVLGQAAPVAARPERRRAPAFSRAPAVRESRTSTTRSDSVAAVVVEDAEVGVAVRGGRAVDRRRRAVEVQLVAVRRDALRVRVQAD